MQPDRPACLVTLSDDQRFQVLMAQLGERYSAWHQMRSRSMQFTLWILGLAVAVSWKLLQEPCADSYQRIAATVLVLSMGGASLYFLTSLARGVQKNREALINVETALGNHATGQFLQERAVLPAEYTDTRPRPSSHFRTLYTLLTVTFLYLLAAIWSPACRGRHKDRASPKNAVTARSPATVDGSRAALKDGTVGQDSKKGRTP